MHIAYISQAAFCVYIWLKFKLMLQNLIFLNSATSYKYMVESITGPSIYIRNFNASIESLFGSYFLKPLLRTVFENTKIQF